MIVNDKLKHNHQEEIFLPLIKRKYVLGFANVDSISEKNLKENLELIKTNKFKKYNFEKICHLNKYVFGS